MKKRRNRPLEKNPEQLQAGDVHASVLLNEVLEYLPAFDGCRYLDGTLGMGGHSEALLRAAGAGGFKNVRLLGLDRDQEALELAGQRLAPYGEAVHLAHRRYSDFAEALDELGWPGVDRALIDIGVSSLQLDSAERGFSFLADGPLDMRMDASAGQSAEALVNRAPVARLKEIIAEYGEEPQAGRIARAIDDARAREPITSTGQLADIVEAAYPAKWRATARNHPATRTFQALRMAVNDELGELRAFLEGIADRLNPGGRVAVISFHSLEDRMVKHFFRQAENPCVCPRHFPFCRCGKTPSLKVLTKKPVIPGEEETARNPRARSAKLRVAEKA